MQQDVSGTWMGLLRLEAIVITTGLGLLLLLAARADRSTSKGWAWILMLAETAVTIGALWTAIGAPIYWPSLLSGLAATPVVYMAAKRLMAPKLT